MDRRIADSEKGIDMDNIKDLLTAIAESDDCDVTVHKFDQEDGPDFVMLMISMAHELGKLEAVKKVVAKEKYSADVVRTILDIELGADA